MPMSAPKIDPRTYDDIAAETESLVQALTGWRPRRMPARIPGKPSSASSAAWPTL